MNNLGGYSPEIDYAVGASAKQSALLPNTCRGAVGGPSNPDGQCILGGDIVGNRCVARPVFMQAMVPYTTGNIAGTDYTQLQQAFFQYASKNYPFVKLQRPGSSYA